MNTSNAWNDLLYPGNATDFFQRHEFPPFKSQANEYNPVNALWLAELSRLVYRHDKEEDNPPPQPSRTDFLVKAGLKEIKFFKHKSNDIDTQAILVESATQPHYAVLVFRGTEQKSGDFITDIKIWKGFCNTVKNAHLSRTSDIQEHAGFKDALDSVWGEIEAELKRLPETCPVFYTGHSLGAALATLATARRQPKATYTFGSPRVGNKAFANTLAKSPIYRIVDDQDIVTELPPEKVLFFIKTGFVHVGEKHQLREDKASPGDRTNSFDPPKPLDDHAPVRYVDRIHLT